MWVNKTVGWSGQGAGKHGENGQTAKDAEDKGRDRVGREGLGNAGRLAIRAKGVGYTGRGTGTADRGRAGQALTFPQHEEVRLLVGVEVSEGRQGAPGLGPKELGCDVVQRPRRDRPDSQQCEPPKQQRQQRPGARQPARRRHGSPSAPALRPSAALDGSRKAPCCRPREKAHSLPARTSRHGLPSHFPLELHIWLLGGREAGSKIAPALTSGRRASRQCRAWGRGRPGGADSRPLGRWQRRRPERDGGGGGAHGWRELEGVGAKSPGQALRFGWLGRHPLPCTRVVFPLKRLGREAGRGPGVEPVPACFPLESRLRSRPSSSCLPPPPKLVVPPTTCVFPQRYFVCVSLRN